VTNLAERLEDYATLRRALGYKPDPDRRLLGGFVRDLDASGQSSVTVDAALAWAAEASTAPASAARLTIVRGFARYLAGFDPATEVPPPGLVRANKVRPTPHIFTPVEIAAVMDAARGLTPGLWAATMSTLVGVMAATGIRPGEAYRLGRHDVDLDAAALAVIHSKHGKSRQIPLHPTTVSALGRYTALRDRAFEVAAAATFFVTADGRPLDSHDVASTFRKLLLATASITPPPGKRPARLGDLRHSFAVSTLLSWHRSGADVPSRLPVLSAYLGHNDPHATYWYLEAVPELMALIARRLERSMGARP